MNFLRLSKSFLRGKLASAKRMTDEGNKEWR